MHNEQNSEKTIKLHIEYRPGFLVEWLIAEFRSITIPNTIRYIKFFMLIFSFLSVCDVILYSKDHILFNFISSMAVAWLLTLLAPVAAFTQLYTAINKLNRVMNFYNGKDITRDVFFDDDAVVEIFPSHKRNENVRRTDYKKVKCIYTYGNFVVVSKHLLSTRKFLLLFYKDQLNCSWEEFESFIREKNPKVKIRSAKLF